MSSSKIVSCPSVATGGDRSGTCSGGTPPPELSSTEVTLELGGVTLAESSPCLLFFLAGGAFGSWGFVFLFLVDDAGAAVALVGFFLWVSALSAVFFSCFFLLRVVFFFGALALFLAAFVGAPLPFPFAGTYETRRKKNAGSNHVSMRGG